MFWNERGGRSDVHGELKFATREEKFSSRF